MVVARVEADYKAPIALGNIFIDVTMWVESIGTSSFKLVYEISQEGVLCAVVKSVQVSVTDDTKSSRPLSQTQLEVLNKYLEKE